MNFVEDAKGLLNGLFVSLIVLAVFSLINLIISKAGIVLVLLVLVGVAIYVVYSAKNTTASLYEELKQSVNGDSLTKLRSVRSKLFIPVILIGLVMIAYVFISFGAMFFIVKGNPLMYLLSALIGGVSYYFSFYAIKKIGKALDKLT